MSERPDLARLYAAAQEAAELVDVACSRDKLWPVLTAFQDAHGSPVVFNMVAGGGRTGDLSFDFMVPPSAGDPYAIALAAGLAEETDHPVRGLFAELQERFSIYAFGVDYGINDGFNKTYAFFPLGELQELAAVAEVPAMPRGLSEQVPAFVRYGLGDKVSAVAIDYARRTWNVYFNGLSPEHVRRDAVRAMMSDFGLPEPSSRLLDFVETSSALYATFGWDSATVERLCFSARTTDPGALPAHLEPKLKKLAAGAPYTYEGDRVLVVAGARSRSEEYYKVAAYHEMSAGAHDRVRAVSTDDAAVRRANRAIVEQYMHTLGQDRLRRHELFTEDGVGGLWTTDTGSPVATHGRDRLAEHAVWSLKCFPDWEWYNIRVFETDDPNHFWVECDGHGKIRFGDYPEGYYENHFLHSFEFEDGKIKRQREFMNGFQQLRALGIPVPEIKRTGIPT